MVCCRQRRHPDNLAAHGGCVLNRIGIETSHHIVENDTRIDLGGQIREMFGNQRGGHDPRIVVILGDDCCEACFGGFTRQLKVIETAGRNRRAAVNMRIDRTNKKIVDALFNCFAGAL